ncbi:MAG TPA: ELM1/GtrOC1 family putative glycosyltransferase, partial [Beijerinckiaceae bacterium]|nr:ELM1/GtrOC1 family putative glycosyltransferase [Beijerinckiaceae bacterium]
ISPERLAAARAAPPYALDRLTSPRVALLIGGDSQHFRFTDDDSARLIQRVQALAGQGASLMATVSRRTPERLATGLRPIVQEAKGFFWDGTGENPYVALLALADAVLVTADSVNMVGEAAATGKPLMVFTPSGGTPKITKFLRGLDAAGALVPVDGTLSLPYEAIDSTPAIAVDLARRYKAHRTPWVIGDER